MSARDPKTMPAPGDVFVKGPAKRFVAMVATTGRRVVVIYHKNIRGHESPAAPQYSAEWAPWRAWVRHAEVIPLTPKDLLCLISPQSAPATPTTPPSSTSPNASATSSTPTPSKSATP